jgi:hypothetical protein
MARAHKVLKSFTPKFHQSYKSLWGNKRGRTMEEIHKELQDLDLICFPHLEEILISENVDLDLTLFPQKDSRSMREMERKGKLSKVNNGRERCKNSHQTRGEEGLL